MAIIAGAGDTRLIGFAAVSRHLEAGVRSGCLPGGDRKPLFFCESIEKTALCVEGKMDTSSGREPGL